MGPGAPLTALWERTQLLVRGGFPRRANSRRGPWRRRPSPFPLLWPLSRRPVLHLLRHDEGLAVGAAQHLVGLVVADDLFGFRVEVQGSTEAI